MSVLISAFRGQPLKTPLGKIFPQTPEMYNGYGERECAAKTAFLRVEVELGMGGVDFWTVVMIPNWWISSEPCPWRNA